MLASAVALGLVGGLAFGGRLRHLRSFEITWLPVLAAAVVLRLAAPLAGPLAVVAYVAAFGAIAAVALRNARLPGMPLIAAGAVLNLVVVGFNGGMPVSADALRTAAASMPADALHRPESGDAHLALLADLIPLPPFRAVYSPGDVLLALGGAVCAFRAVRP